MDAILFAFSLVGSIVAGLGLIGSILNLSIVGILLCAPALALFVHAVDHMAKENL